MYLLSETGAVAATKQAAWRQALGGISRGSWAFAVSVVVLPAVLLLVVPWVDLGSPWVWLQDLTDSWTATVILLLSIALVWSFVVAVFAVLAGLRPFATMPADLAKPVEVVEY
jgi:hypothetical protein